jgi:hypothetical protein
MFKICNKCSKEKPLTEFFKDKSNKTDGYYSICKDCKTKSTLAYRAKNKDLYNAKMRAYRKINYQAERLYRYKLTVAQHQAMLAEQNHVCAICKCPPKGKRPLVVDHRHSDGKVRGLLCYGCNRALHVLESIDLLQKAQDYLKKYE